MWSKLMITGSLLASAGLVLADGGDPQAQKGIVDGVEVAGVHPVVTPDYNPKPDFEKLDLLWSNGPIAYDGVRVLDDEEIDPAALLYNNGGADYANGYEMTNWIEANDFTLAARARLSRVDFSVLDTTVGNLNNWDGRGQWYIYANASGAPGSLIDSGNLSGITATFDRNANNWDFYDFSANLDTPVTLNAGTYFLGLHLNTGCSTLDGLYWTTAPANGTLSRYLDQFCDGGFSSGPSESAFSLQGTLLGGQQVCVDFDDIVAPCSFGLTTALRSAYSFLGITFDGPAARDGGGLLDECGNFGVGARSGTNFLAFNRGSLFSDGGVPRDPETVRFSSDASKVSIYCSGGGQATSFRMVAYDAGGNSIGSDSVNSPAGGYGQLSISASGIRRVVISEVGGDAAFVMDDLCVTFAVAPKDTIWGIDNSRNVLGTFTTDNPSVFTDIGATNIATGFTNSLEFDGSGKLWASDGTQLFSINTSTGAATLVGSHGNLNGETITDFTWDGSTLWAIGSACGVQSSLWKINRSTGAATFVCTTDISGACDVGLTRDSQGVLYGHDLVTDTIYRLDPSSCRTSTLINLPYDSNFGQGLTSNTSSGANYHVAFNNTAFQGELYSFDGAGSYNFLGVLGPLQIAAADVKQGSDTCLSMRVSRLVAGQQGTWDVSGGKPGEQIAVVYGFQAGTTKVNNLFGYCATFGIKGVKTTTVVCKKIADTNGNIQCKVPIPTNVKGKRLLTQAAMRNTCPGECMSNIDNQVIQ